MPIEANWDIFDPVIIETNRAGKLTDEQRTFLQYQLVIASRDSKIVMLIVSGFFAVIAFLATLLPIADSSRLMVWMGVGIAFAGVMIRFIMLSPPLRDWRLLKCHQWTGQVAVELVMSGPSSSMLLVLKGTTTDLIYHIPSKELKAAIDTEETYHVYYGGMGRYVYLLSLEKVDGNPSLDVP